MDTGKYHPVYKNARVKSIKSGRFTFTPVDPIGDLNNFAPFLKTSQLLLENGRFNIKIGPDQEKKSTTQYHNIPKNAKITKIETGRFTTTPVSHDSLYGPVKKTSTVTYNTGKITVRKGPHVKKHHSVGGRASKRKTNSSKRKSRRNKRYIV
jgi:hypothetical protein